jgi:hypothetical protein
MPNQQIIGIDIDGCLANFNKAYREILIATTGRDLIPEECCRGSRPGEEPPVWDYAPHFGYTKDEDRATWKAIRESRTFWQDLDALPGVGGFLWDLDIDAEIGENAPEVYFITTRPGNAVKNQTVTWLSEHRVDFPTVLITRGDKGQLAAGLGLTHFLDDKPENCFDVKAARPECAVYLLSCRYNEAQQNECRMRGITVIYSIDQFRQVLKRSREQVAA